MDKIIDYKKLRDSRVDKDLKQKEIAAKLNIEQSTYSKMEKGKIGIRPEQLAIIAEAVGRNIEELLKQEAKTNNNKNSQEVLKAENEFFKSMLSLISANVDGELSNIFSDYHLKFINKHPHLYEMSFKEYLDNEDHVHNNPGYNSPDYAVGEIKQDIERFKKEGVCSVFYKEWNEMGLEYFIGKSDEWLYDFVIKEENYGIVYKIIDTPFSFYNEYANEDYYLAFKDMLKENPVIHNLFQYGLLEKSSFSDEWNEYLKEMKPTLTGDGSSPCPSDFIRERDGQKELHEIADFIARQPNDLITTKRDREEREKIREKMKSLLPDKY